MVLPFYANFHVSLNNHPTIGMAFVFLVFIPFVVSVSFEFHRFRPDDPDIFYTGSATTVNDFIQLTANEPDLSGRAIYAEPLQLYDVASGKLTDFTSNFSFVIDSQGATTYADGLVFFLANTHPSTQDNVGGGRRLVSGSDPYSFVAVKFDIFQNLEEPLLHRVYIGVNSMTSAATTTWFSSIADGATNYAWITYDSQSMNLTVEFTGFQFGEIVIQSLTHHVDLRRYLTEEVTFGLAAATRTASAEHSIYSWNFSSTLDTGPRTMQGANPPTNLEIVPRLLQEASSLMSPDSGPGTMEGADSPPSEPTEINNSPPTKSKSKTGPVTGIIVGVSVLIGVLCILLITIRKRMRRGKTDYQEETMINKMPENDTMINQVSEFERGSVPKKFTYTELVRATNNFAEQEKLGKGASGGVYKAYNTELNAYVAVKRISKESTQRMKEYASEVTIIGRLSHKNLVKLLGWCHEKDELLLVYQFMPNGSLDSHLFKRKGSLAWEMRYKIAKGIATALHYLHEELEQCVLHRDIKSSNVMLDSEFNAKLGDFGLARLVDHERESRTTIVAGTIGYMAPEIFTTGKPTKETDVYSFGVVVLEIACGRPPINNKAQKGEVNLVEWVWSLYGTDKLLAAVDSRLSPNFNEEVIKHLMMVGLWCAHPDRYSRPSIRDAILVLNFEAPLPELPSSLPVLIYGSPSRSIPS